MNYQIKTNKPMREAMSDLWNGKQEDGTYKPEQGGIKRFYKALPLPHLPPPPLPRCLPAPSHAIPRRRHPGSTP